jgi:hypothetical protein
LADPLATPRPPFSDAERGGLEEYRRRLGGGERETECSGLRRREAFGGGECETDGEGLRRRDLGGGECETERETEREGLRRRVGLGAGERERLDV